MAEPQSATPSANPQTGARPADKTLDKTLEGERRSFDNGDALGKTGQSARELAGAAVETGRQMAETGRKASHEIADQWRSSLEPLTAMQMDMNRWFDDMWRFATGFSAFPTLRGARPFGAMGAAHLFGLPAADVKEAKDAYTLAVELPGLTRQDIDLAVHDGSVTICGHKAEETEDATAAYRISERRFGRFERSFPLPPDVDAKRIGASFQDGVLKVTLPKSADAAARRSKIEIKG